MTKKKWKKKYDLQLDETVPEGWRYRTVNAGHGRKNKVFQIEDGLTIYGRKSAAEFMKERNYNEKDIKKVLSGLRKATIKSFNYKKIYDDWSEDENIPLGWKYKTGESGKGERIDSVVNSDGKVFENRVDAIKFMKEEDFDPQNILKIWSTLKQEGWLYERGLPNGWRV